MLVRLDGTLGGSEHMLLIDLDIERILVENLIQSESVGNSAHSGILFSRLVVKSHDSNNFSLDQ